MIEGRVVLGIDPGTATLGYGLVVEQASGFTSSGWGAVTTPAGMPLPERLLLLYRGLHQLLERFHPAEVAVEQLFFARNATTAMAVGQARGVALLVAAQAGLHVGEYTPAQVKQAVVGSGRADKAQVQEMVRMILGLDQVPQPDDAADALALAICHLNTRGFERWC